MGKVESVNNITKKVMGSRLTACLFFLSVYLWGKEDETWDKRGQERIRQEGRLQEVREKSSGSGNF